jgi:hypothetical protein
MKVAKNNASKPGRLNNGLTTEQVEKAKALLAKVNVSQVCRTTQVKRSTLENVLRDESPRVGELKKVLEEAKRIVNKKEKTIRALPL